MDEALEPERMESYVASTLLPSGLFRFTTATARSRCAPRNSRGPAGANLKAAERRVARRLGGRAGSQRPAYVTWVVGAYRAAESTGRFARCHNTSHPSYGHE